MRHFVIFIVAMIALVGSLVASVGTITIRDFELRGYVDPTVDQNLPFMVTRLGVNVELRQYNENELHQNLQLMQESGFVWIRQFAYWDEIEPIQGEFNWSQWDMIVNAMRDYPDLEPVVVFMNSPLWARIQLPDRDVIQTAPPQSKEHFAHFVQTFTTRYGDVIDYYQVWDEPNLDDAWGLLDPNPTEYVALLQSAYMAIHNTDSSATVISAGLAPTTETSGQNMSDIRFLQAMYQRGAKDNMDVVAGKPYGFSLSSLERTVDEATLNFSRIIALREVMVQHGDAKKPLWASNWGWNSLPDDWQGDASLWGNVTSDEQIQYTLQGLDRAHREWPWLGAMILHHWQPDVEKTDPQWGFALVDSDNQPTTLLNHIQKYSLPDLPQNGLFHPLTPFVRYSGVWEFSEQGADIGWLETTDSQFQFVFVGSDLALLLREGDYVAFLYPTIDGQQANATPKDTNGNAYIFLRSNSQEDEKNLVPIATDLSVSQHRLNVVADKGWDQWAIAGFAVSSGNLTLLYDVQIAIGLLAAFISFMFVMASAIVTPWTHLVPSLGIIFRGMSITSHIIISFITSMAMMFAMLLTWSSSRPNILIRDDINLLLAIVSGGAFYLSPNFIFTIIAAFVLFVLIYHRLETGLILTLFWAPFFVFPLELEQLAFPMAEVMILITSSASLFRLLVQWGTELQMGNSAYPIMSVDKLKEHITAIDLSIIGIVIVAIISLLWTERQGDAITELREMIIEPALFYLILRSLRPNKQFLLRLADTIIIAALIVSIYGLITYMLGENIITAESGARRLASVYGSPNNVGLLMGRTIPFVLAYVLIPIDRSRRIFGIVSTIIMGITVALTQSIGAILMGIPAAIVVIMFALYGRKSILPLAGIGAMGVIGFGILTQLSARFANILDFTTGTNFFRLRVWDSAIEIIQDFPITGIGLNQFLYVFRGKYIRPDAIWDRDLSHPHNFILDFWTRLGIVGVMLFIIIQISFWRSALHILKQARNHDTLVFALTVGLIGSMADLLVHGLIDNSVFVKDLAFIFMFQIGMMVSLKNIRFIDGA